MKKSNAKNIISFASGFLIIIAIVLFAVLPMFKEKSSNEPDVKTNPIVSGGEQNEQEDQEDTDYEKYFADYQGDVTYLSGYEPKIKYDVDNKVPYNVSRDHIYGYTKEERDFSEYILSTEFYNGEKTDIPLTKDRVKTVGEEFLLYDRMDYLTINDVKIYDSVKELEEDDFDYKDSLYDYINKDGSFKELYYTAFDVDSDQDNRTAELIDSNNFKEAKKLMKQRKLKFMVINATLRSNHPWVETVPLNNLFVILPMTGKEDGLYPDYDINGRYFVDVEGNEDKAMSVMMTGKGLPNVAAMYYHESICRNNGRAEGFFVNYVGRNETMNFSIGYWVDEDIIDDLYLLYSFNCKPYINPNNENKCQVAVKLTSKD